MAHDPVGSISSTSHDLKQHREQAAKAASASGFSPGMMEITSKTKTAEKTIPGESVGMLKAAEYP
jgi:hypothetical protein